MTSRRPSVQEQDFADDCILYREITSDLDQHLLQHDLDRLASWEKKRGIEFPQRKCSVLRISRARSPVTFHYHHKGVTLAEEQILKYLDVDIQSNLMLLDVVMRLQIMSIPNDLNKKNSGTGGK